MKKLFFLLFMLSIIGAHAQVSSNFYIFTRQYNPDVIDPGPSMGVNGDTVICTNMNISGMITCRLMFYNVGNDTPDVACRRNIIYEVPGSSNAITYITSYPPNVSVTASEPCSNGDTAYFEANYFPNNNAGTTTILYKFFNAADTNDYFTTTVIFYPSFAGLDDNEIHTTVYPNPCTDQIQFSFQPLQQGSELVITDVNGKQVSSVTIPVGSEKYLLNVNDWSQGVYFYSILTNGTILSKGKFLKE